MKKLICAVALTFAMGASVQAQDLSVATGGTGGVYFLYGGGVAELITKYVDGASAMAEVIGVLVENVNLIASIDSDIALALADTVYAAYTGTGLFDGMAVLELRALMSIYLNAVQIVIFADSGITSIEDLRGQRVSVGAFGSGIEVSVQTLLAANGIIYDDFELQRLNFNETADALRDGDIVVGFWSVGFPTLLIMNFAAMREIMLVLFSQVQVDAALEAEPTFACYMLCAGLYEGVTELALTISMLNVLIVNAEMDEELVYQITKTIYDNVDELIAIYPVANDTTVEFALDSIPILLYFGALCYFEEVGVTILDRMRP